MNKNQKLNKPIPELLNEDWEKFRAIIGVWRPFFYRKERYEITEEDIKDLYKDLKLNVFHKLTPEQKLLRICFPSKYSSVNVCPNCDLGSGACNCFETPNKTED